MTNGFEINSDKILLKDVFEMWFSIPEYQRPYVWGSEEIHDLLDDLTFAATHKPTAEYFMGSFVFQSKPADSKTDQTYDDNDLLDGQQRLTTLLLLLAVMRDMTTINEIKTTCQSCIFQKADKFKHIPERMRLTFNIRPKVEEFFEKYIKDTDGTKKVDSTYPFDKFADQAKDVSVENMAYAVRVIRDFLDSEEGMEFEPFFDFLLNRVMLIYVSTENLDDAFRLFTILNDRGIPLRNSDILKSINLGMLESETEKAKYARMWENAEGDLGNDFERFLNHVRTILVKDKSRLSLLREFEDRIYHPKEKDKATGKVKPVLLQKGKPTFELIERYLGHYRELINGMNYDVCRSHEFDNLIGVMLTGLPATDWVPPLLRFFDKFGTVRLFDFLNAVNRKFAGDWICQRTPTDRIEAMNFIIKTIESSMDADAVLDSDIYKFDANNYHSVVQDNVYGRRFTRYILLMLDYLYQNHDQKMHFETISVEHILPQNPAENSQWVKDFSDEQREEWTHRLGNLVIITRRKNTSQGRLDYDDKKRKYFDKIIDTCPNSLRVLNQNTVWTPIQISANHQLVLGKLADYFSVPMPEAASE